MNTAEKIKETFLFGQYVVDSLLLINDPSDLKRTLRISNYQLERTKQDDLDKFAAQFNWTPEAIKAVEERYRIDMPTVEELLQHNPGTLAHEFGKFLKKYDLDPNAVTPPEVTDDLSYLAAHYSETHDLWHFITGFEPLLDGEAGVAAFAAAQTASPFQYGVVAGTLLHGLQKDISSLPARMEAINRGWMMGKAARQLTGIRWEQYWNTPVDEVREQLGISLA